MEAPGFGAVFAALPVAALIVDPDGRIRHANAACEQLLVRSERAMLGLSLGDVIALPPGYESAGQGFALFDGEFRTGRGQPFRADFGAEAIADHPGWRAITLHSAIGSRRLAQPGGARAATGAAAMLAHEVKNPLSGIRGAAQLLAGSGHDAQLTGLITAEVDRIAALIDRMQDFTDTRPLALSAQNVHPLIDHVRRLAEAGFAAGVPIDERFDPSLPPALLARDAFVQVLLNLLRNAVEAGAATVQLTSAYRHGLAVRVAGGGERLPLPIEVCVIDDGPGAPAEIVDHLFEPFVSGKPEGRGLGLALVDKLVRQMGGVVQHAREGTGREARTVFRLLLARGAA